MSQLVRMSPFLLSWLSACSLLLGACGEGGKSSVATKALAEQTPEESSVAALLKKAEAGEATAQYDLGEAYDAGKGVPKDAAKAFEWFQKAAAMGFANGQFKIGRAYEAGDGVPKDLAKAREWYGKAAAQGNVKAQVNLGGMYYLGEGEPKDVAKAIEWYEKAAGQGNSAAQYNLGLVYAESKKDAAKAREWFEKAAALGEAKAQDALGDIYIKGEGVPKDAPKAVEWYQKAAGQGLAAAQNSLGMAYALGNGLPKDAVKALEWYQKAAEQGDERAQHNLGAAYFRGYGVSRDSVLGYAWINLAASKGDSQSIAAREIVEKLITTSELTEAQRISSKWKKGELLAREGQSVPTGISPSDSSGTLKKMGTGTAFVVAKSGRAITNHHVTDGCKEVRVQGRDGLAKVLTSDVINDLALLQITDSVHASSTLNAEPSKLRQGEEVVVYGFPLNSVLSSGGNFTPGVVSAMTGLGNNTNQIQITAPIQPGSSGSPVLNKKGEVVAVVSMKLSDLAMMKSTGQIGQNVNFAVSGQTLKTFLDTQKVSYASGGGFFSREKSSADLADEARKWTFIVECWK